MRRILIGLALLITPILLFAQSQRVVLLEQFVNVNCDSCASANTAIDALDAANPGKLTQVRYHVSWPGQDPFNAPVLNEVDQRRSWYAVSGIPTAVMDGNVYNADPTLDPITQTDIDDQYAVDSPFDIMLSHSISNDFDSVYVEFVMEATLNVSGGLKAHTMIAEQTTTMATAPGSNGETTFSHVARAFLSGASGDAMTTVWNIGDRDTINYAWAIQDINDIQQIEVVAFIQDSSSRVVHQSAISSPITLTPTTINDAYVVTIMDVDTMECDSSITPSILIRNNGSAMLTSLDIDHEVNGGGATTMNWTGSLSFLESEVVPLAAYTYVPGAPNTLTVSSSNPNASPDDDPANDVQVMNFNSAPIAHPWIYYEIKTDDYGHEIKWILQDGSGSIIAADTSGNYGDNQLYYDSLYVPASDCYEFIIMDEFGDGICCQTDSGYFKVADYTGQIFTIARDFGFQAVAPFYVDVVLSNGTEPITYHEPLFAYPNPYEDSFRIDYASTSGESVLIQMISLTGELVYENTHQMFVGGNTIEILTQEIPAGIYLLNLHDGNKRISKRMISL